MNYADRLYNYLRRHPNKSSAPELTHLTSAHKMNHRKAQALRRKREGNQ